MAYDYQFDYGEIYALMRKFRNLSKQEVRILDYLMARDYADITYSELARELGDEKNVSNVRKSLLNLQSMGIVCIVNKHYEDEEEQHRNNPMKACYIVDGWLLAFLAGGWDKVA